MNYAAIKANNVKLLLVDETQAGAMCGKVTVFKELCERYRITPAPISRKSVKLWFAADIESAVARLKLDQVSA